MTDTQTPVRLEDRPRPRRRAGVALAVGAVLVALAGASAGVLALSGGDEGPAAAPGGKDKIANAMSAAPASVSKDATILDNPAKPGEKYPVLRPGTNGWSCFPDYDATPANDPGCYDRNAMVWVDAFLAGKKPELSSPGISYWLQGTSDASMTDPLATEPAPGQDWVYDGPHMTIFPTEPIKDAGYPASHGENHDMGGGSVMWPGTPYEHIHVPVG